MNEIFLPVVDAVGYIHEAFFHGILWGSIGGALIGFWSGWVAHRFSTKRRTKFEYRPIGGKNDC